jgi:hypothetical protein
MIETITLALINESGDFLAVEDQSPRRIENDLDIACADLFTNICARLSEIKDEEIRRAEKFFFALNLKNYLKEM